MFKHKSNNGNIKYHIDQNRYVQRNDSIIALNIKFILHSSTPSTDFLKYELVLIQLKKENILVYDFFKFYYFIKQMYVLYVKF